MANDGISLELKTNFDVYILVHKKGEEQIGIVSQNLKSLTGILKLAI